MIGEDELMHDAGRCDAWTCEYGHDDAFDALWSGDEQDLKSVPVRTEGELQKLCWLWFKRGQESHGDDHRHRVRFVLPMLPVSVNSLYQIIYTQRRVELKPECRAFKTQMKQYVPQCTWAKDALLRLTLEFHSTTWYHKNGKLKRLDVQNLEKLVIDTIFEKIGCDDSRIVEKRSVKRVGTRDQISVMLEAIDEGGFQR